MIDATRSAIGSAALALAVGVVFIVPGAAQSQAKRYALESATGLQLHNVSAEPETLQGKKGVRVAIAQDAQERLKTMSPDQQANAELDQIAVLEGSDFGDGIIEAEIAGQPASGSFEGARGFVGIAFRVSNDIKIYDAFYLRPTNGRADDQERRNHATQYISRPDWPWFRLRKETPGKYESYVDLMPATWTKIKIEVRGDHARLYVHDQEQPCLIVNDVKTGAHARGAVALWIGTGAVGHFRNVSIQP
jgi:hypothetical protein